MKKCVVLLGLGLVLPSFALEITIGLGEDRAIDDTEAAQLTGTEPLVKKGPGKLTMDRNLSAWTGDTTIEAGTLSCTCSGALGAETKTAKNNGALTIGADGTLEYAFAENNASALTYRKSVRLEGTIKNGTSKSQYNALSYSGSFVVDGSSAVMDGNGARIDFRGSTASPLTFNEGATLTVKKGTCGITGIPVAAGGDIIVEDGGTLAFEGVKSFADEVDAHSITVADGGAVSFKNQGKAAPPWKLVTQGDATLTVNAGSSYDNDQVVWAGSVELGGTATLKGALDRSLTIDGVVSGEGSFKATSLTLYLKNTSNTFSGGVVWDGGRVIAPEVGAYDLQPDSTGSISVENPGGVIAAQPTLDENVGVTNWAGDLVLSTPGPSEIGGVYVYGGTVTMTNMGFVYGDKRISAISGEWPDIARLIVADGTTFAGFSTTANVDPGAFLYVGYGYGSGRGSEKRPRAVLEVKEGAIVTNRLEIGSDPNWKTSTKSAGAVYVQGGTLGMYYNNAKAQVQVGGRGYGFLGLDEGRIDVGSTWMLFGGNCADTGAGIYQQTGGTYLQTGSGLKLAVGSAVGEVYVAGGSFEVVGSAFICQSDRSRSGLARGTVTVAGGEATFGGNMMLGMMSNSVSTVNLNGGVTTFYMINVATNGYKDSHGNVATLPPDAPSVTYLNFNGGTFRPSAAKTAVSVTNLTRVTVFEGGAVFDTNGKNLTTPFAEKLCRPTGNGVAKIDIPDEMAALPAGSFIGSPVVEVSGDGIGATAHAVFDTASGRVTSIVVTNPGWDYTEATATISSGGWTNSFTVPLTVANGGLKANAATGGLVKRGLGTLTLANPANEYGGATTVEAGTLVASVEGAIPLDNPLIVADGAELDVGGRTHPCASLTTNGGKIDGSVVTGELVVDATKRNAAEGSVLEITGSLAFGDNAMIKVENAQSLGENFDKFDIVTVDGAISGEPTLVCDRDDVHLTRTARGFRFAKNRGLMVILR